MIVFINREDFFFDAKTYLKVFFPNEIITLTNVMQPNVDFMIRIEDQSIFVAYYEYGIIKYERQSSNEQIHLITVITNPLEKRKLQKRLMKWLLHDVAYTLTKVVQPWGILTGIRPTKVVFKLIEQYDSDIKKIKSILKDDYKITEDKINLMLEVAYKERDILNKNKPSEVNIYIGIPFCPSKCLYCSFTSYPIKKWKGEVDFYLDALNKEVEYVSQQLDKGQKIPIRSIYIGGGTPTSLDERSLEKLLLMINRGFLLNKVEEFTVEAGRPDTITEAKLKLLKQYGVNRISINPQTMNKKTLEFIGRQHSPEEIFVTYDMARKIGFRTINMDVIVGLPRENTDDVRNTMLQIKKMMPNNITVHTMAYKRGSRLLEESPQFTLTTAQEIGEMIDTCKEASKDMGLDPYYLYRQKHMVGNFENVGYAKSGHECIYNVEIIEEKANILAIGVGGVSKIVHDNGRALDRIENLKDVSGYINRIDEMLERKRNSIRML